MAGDRKDSLDTAFLLLEILKRIPKKRKIMAADLRAQLADYVSCPMVFDWGARPRISRRTRSMSRSACASSTHSLAMRWSS